MWGKKKGKNKQHQSTTTHFDTLISGKTQIVGDLQFSGGLHIDGLVRGTIRAEEDSEAIVRISDIGEIDGDVIAPHIIVNGTVHGDVYASKHIELAANASIKGNVYYHLIEMAMGAEVNGNLVHHKEPVSIKHHESQESTLLPEQVSLKAISSETNTISEAKVSAASSSAKTEAEKVAKSSNTAK